MQISTIMDGSITRFVKIWDKDKAACIQLENAAAALSQGRGKRADIVAEAISPLSLSFIAGMDEGLLLAESGQCTVCLNPDRWSVVAELVNGFRTYQGDHRVHQWLVGPAAIEEVAVGTMSLLLTEDEIGGW